MRIFTIILAVIALSSCGSEAPEDVLVIDTTSDAGDTAVADMGVDVPDVTEDIDLGPFGGDRPAKVTLPFDWSPDKTYPVVVLLHGIGVTSALQNLFFQAGALVDTRQFILVLPEGTRGPRGQFWNATDRCCDIDNSGVDDSTYLIELGEDAVARYGGDPKRLYFLGHSNGGFMSYRLACDHSDKIAGIASVAGSGWLDATKCGDPSPVSVLQIHGDADNTVPYNLTGPPIVARWVERNGCDSEAELLGRRNYDTAVDGEEARIERYNGCEQGTSVEFWTLEGSDHIPTVGQPFTNDILDFLFAHPKL